MKYTIEVTHTVETVKVYDITADSEEKARDEALKYAATGLIFTAIAAASDMMSR